MVGNSDNQHHTLKRSGNTSDIMAAILTADAKAAPYTTELAKSLKRSTISATCKAIFEWVRLHIEYVEDPEGFQYIQSPGHLYWGKDGKGNGQGDCKSMSLFCASILQNLGLKYAYRFVSQSHGQDYHHVFVVVPDENGGLINLDCVDSSFNQQTRFAKKKDIPGGAKAAIGGFAAYVKDPTITINTPSADPTKVPVVVDFGKAYYDWAAYLIDYHKEVGESYEREKAVLVAKVDRDWKTMMAWAIFDPISTSLLGAKGRNKTKGYYNDMLDGAMFHQCMYRYWDNAKAPFPAYLESKRKQANEFADGLLNSKINQRRTAVFKDNSLTPYVTEFTIRLYTDWHCFLTYGYPMQLLLQKAYNMVNFGTESLPFFGQPYYDLKQDRWIANGASAKDLADLDLCLPFNGPKFRAYGTPYWAKGGFIFPNGAIDKVVTDFKKKNPIPTGLKSIYDTIVPGTNTKITAFDADLWIVYLTNWYLKNVIEQRKPLNEMIGFNGLTNQTKPNGFGGVTTVDVTTKKGFGAGVSGKAKIGCPICPAIIPPIVAALATIIGAILAFIDKTKSKQQVKTDMSNYPSDFKNGYKTVDGCDMQPVNVNGAISYTKICPDGSRQENADPNAPGNRPANAGGIFGLSKGSSIGIIALGLFAGSYLLFFSDTSKSSKS